MLKILTLSHKRCSDVEYQPKNIGVKDINAGKSQIKANMRNTVRCVIYKGYSILKKEIQNVYEKR